MKYFKILLYLVIFCFGFFSAVFYTRILNKRYEEMSINKSIKLTKNSWGEPDLNYINEKEISYVYKTFLINKFVFTYSKKDSLLVKKWKEN